ncbi:hypothetical protein BT63DRAFT_478457 [Microthyrium microscopicum]|uniref:Uncharacterized protein n=1 Tax=Microthyrium microscopicum TaxID=703497 RepID=A0A6A6UFQ3_9PEZI|nr:hypothetical protein BT63DRAFT_478457 [Microthyrium microscopicum]
MQFTTFVAALSSLSLIAAAPAASVGPNQQSCKATDFLSNVSYGLTIGVSFPGTATCNNIKNQLSSGINDQNFGNFFCTQGSASGTTSISFQSTHNKASVINSVLGNNFPSVNGFNCPNF